MDKNMTNLSHLLRNRGITCIDTDSTLSKENCKKALAQGGIFVTSDLSLYNEKLVMLICCLNKKDNVTKQFDSL